MPKTAVKNRGKIDLVKLSRMLSNGASSKHCAQFFKVSPAAKIRIV